MAFLKGIRRLKSCTLRPKKMAAVCHQKAAASPERKPKEDLPSSSKIVHGGLLKKGKECGFAFGRLPGSKATHGTRKTSVDLRLPDSEPPRSRGAVVLYLTASPRESPYCTSSNKSPGLKMSPCFSFVLPLQGKLSTFFPSSSSGTEIFISIFIDSSTQSGAPFSKTSPGFTAYESSSPGTTAASWFGSPGVAFRGPDVASTLAAFGSGSCTLICDPQCKKLMRMSPLGAVPKPAKSTSSRCATLGVPCSSSKRVLEGRVLGLRCNTWGATSNGVRSVPCACFLMKSRPFCWYPRAVCA